MNTDLCTGHIKVLPKCADLIDEWEALVWDERQLALGKYIEHPALDNHLCDAALYAWRYAYHYTAKPKTFVPNADPMDKWWEAEEERIQNKDDENEDSSQTFGEEIDPWTF